MKKMTVITLVCTLIGATYIQAEYRVQAKAKAQETHNHAKTKKSTISTQSQHHVPTIEQARDALKKGIHEYCENHKKSKYCTAFTKLEAARKAFQKAQINQNNSETKWIKLIHDIPQNEVVETAQQKSSYKSAQHKIDKLNDQLSALSSTQYEIQFSTLVDILITKHPKYKDDFKKMKKDFIAFQDAINKRNTLETAFNMIEPPKDSNIEHLGKQLQKAYEAL